MFADGWVMSPRRERSSKVVSKHKQYGLFLHFSYTVLAETISDGPVQVANELHRASGANSVG